MPYLPSLLYTFAFECPDCGGDWTELALIDVPANAEFVTTICPECLGEQIQAHWWKAEESDDDVDFNVS